MRSPVEPFSASRPVQPKPPSTTDWNQLFTELDKNHNGRLSQIEIIRRINEARKQDDRSFLARISKVLGLPDHVKQEDGSRDIFERVFQAMDQDEDKEITLDEFQRFCALHAKQSPSATPSPRQGAVGGYLEGQERKLAPKTHEPASVVETSPPAERMPPAPEQPPVPVDRKPPPPERPPPPKEEVPVPVKVPVPAVEVEAEVKSSRDDVDTPAEPHGTSYDAIQLATKTKSPKPDLSILDDRSFQEELNLVRNPAYHLSHDPRC